MMLPLDGRKKKLVNAEIIKQALSEQGSIYNCRRRRKIAETTSFFGGTVAR